MKNSTRPSTIEIITLNIDQQANIITTNIIASLYNAI